MANRAREPLDHCCGHSWQKPGRGLLATREVGARSTRSRRMTVAGTDRDEPASLVSFDETGGLERGECAEAGWNTDTGGECDVSDGGDGEPGWPRRLPAGSRSMRRLLWPDRGRVAASPGPYRRSV